MRNFGLPSERLTTGANHQPPATHDDHSPRDPLIPSGSILSPGPSFEHDEIAQAAIDVSLAIFFFLTCSVFGLAITGALLVWVFL